MTSSFTPWLLISTLAAATVAVWLMRAMLGNTLDFAVPQVSPTANWSKWPFLGLGVLLGVVGAIYNVVILALLRVADKLATISSLVRAAIIGGVVGLMAWFVPAIVGGGDNLLTDCFILSNQFTLKGLTILFLVRFVTPGHGPPGRYAGRPLLPAAAAGALSGVSFAGTINHLAPGADVSTVACAIIGMGALFTASVRAPLTGIVLGG